MEEEIKVVHKKEFQGVEVQKKKYYSEPMLSRLGSMQKVTLGGSQLDADSGEGLGTGETGGW